MIVIVNYGMGNVRSVQKAFERLGYEAQVSDSPALIERATHLVLPGVGAFADAMHELHRRRLIEPLRRYIASGRPFLGICLGLQLLFEASEENGEHIGLGILPGRVVRLQAAGLKIPHMGWNQLRILRPAPIFASLREPAWVYFVHSYYAVPTDSSVVAAEADYPQPFAAAVWRDRIVATQFHPEKSQRVGLTMLHDFARMA
ncbi:MAG: imidazole glycerol phosphate synthase subunit HisH [Gemmataceae bacterium]